MFDRVFFCSSFRFVVRISNRKYTIKSNHLIFPSHLCDLTGMRVMKTTYISLSLSEPLLVVEAIVSRTFSLLMSLNSLFTILQNKTKKRSGGRIAFFPSIQFTCVKNLLCKKKYELILYRNHIKQPHLLYHFVSSCDFPFLFFFFLSFIKFIIKRLFSLFAPSFICHLILFKIFVCIRK